MAAKSSLLGAYRRLWPYLRRYRLQAAGIVVFGAFAAIGSKATMVFFKPLVDRLFPDAVEAPTSGAPLLDQWSHDSLEPFLATLGDWGLPPGISPVVFMVLVMMAMAAVFAVAQYLFIRLSRMLGAHMITDLRQDLAEHLVSMGMAYHSDRRLGDLLSRLTIDVTTSLRVMTLMVEELLQAPFSILASLAVAYVAEPTATIGMLLFMPLLILPVTALGPKVRRRSRESQESLGDTTQSLLQILSGIRVVKAFRMEEREAQEFRRGNDEFVFRTKRMVRAQAASLAVTSFFASGGVGLVLALLVLVHMLWMPVFSGVGSMMTYFVAIGTLFAYAKRLTRAFSAIYTSLGSIDRVFEVLDVQPDASLQSGSRPCPELRASIRFEGVGFSYPGADGPALQDIDFEVQRGERVALVGLSGAGKSTLLDLVARFYDPTEGRILVDGIDLREVKREDWLDRLALVQQHPFLFQASLRENVAYGRRGADDAAVRRACSAAQLDDFLARLPEGLDTQAGDSGARLSGGQAQRVTIARAILKDADILLLDEATSALDSDSERKVQEALNNLMEGRTTFVIAHRLSTVRSADRILVLDGGRLVEAGTHDDLVAAGGAYARLWELQAGPSMTSA